MRTDAEAEADRAQNKPVWDSVENFFSFIFPPHGQKWLIIRASRGNYLWLIAAAEIFKDSPEGCVRGQVCLADLPGRWLMLCVLLICTTLPESTERGCGTHGPLCFDKTRAGRNTLPPSSWKQWRSDLDGRNTASNPPRCSDNLYSCYHRCFQ